MDASGKQISMTPEQVRAATDQLIANVESRAVQSGENVEARQAALAPGLVAQSNVPGGYNYQRLTAPNVDVMTTALTTGATQALVRQAMADAAWRAQENYTKEKMAYDARYRAYQNEQARRQRERQRRAEAEAAKLAQAQLNALRNQGTPGTVGGVTITPTTLGPQVNPQKTVNANKIQNTVPASSLQGGSGARIQGSSGINLQGGGSGLLLLNNVRF